MKDIEHWEAQEAKILLDHKPRSLAHLAVRSKMEAIGSCQQIIQGEVDYAASASFKLLFEPILLMDGKWGTGKTHFVCDVTEQRLKRGTSTVLVLAKNFQGDIISNISARLQIDSSKNIFDELEILGQASSERTIFIVDGINEGMRREWKKTISCLLSLIATRHNIGLVVTCRTPFEELSIEQSDLKKFQRLKHEGFADQEFDAQAVFFEYYQLPLPQVPLLEQEFSRPLTLKLICESLKKLPEKKRAKGFTGIASGQKGMTSVLESFVKGVGEPIEAEFGLGDKGCWNLLKGTQRDGNKLGSEGYWLKREQRDDKSMIGFAPCMAKNLRGYVLRSEADRIIRSHYPKLKPAKRRQLLEMMRTRLLHNLGELS